MPDRAMLAIRRTGVVEWGNVVFAVGSCAAEFYSRRGLLGLTQNGDLARQILRLTGRRFRILVVTQLALEKLQEPKGCRRRIVVSRNNEREVRGFDVPVLKFDEAELAVFNFSRYVEFDQKRHFHVGLYEPFDRSYAVAGCVALFQPRSSRSGGSSPDPRVLPAKSAWPAVVSAERSSRLAPAGPCPMAGVDLVTGHRL
jgi:hypothetical protein